MKDCKSGGVLVVFPHGVGDAVMATPSFRALRHDNPKSRIDIAIQPVVANSSLLAGCPYFDDIYTIDNPWHAPTLQKGFEILERHVEKIVDFVGHADVRWVRHMPTLEYDVIVDLYESLFGKKRSCAFVRGYDLSQG